MDAVFCLGLTGNRAQYDLTQFFAGLNFFLPAVFYDTAGNPLGPAFFPEVFKNFSELFLR